MLYYVSFSFAGLVLPPDCFLLVSKILLCTILQVLAFFRSTSLIKVPCIYHLMIKIGFYRENAIAIESEARDPNGGNVYYVTMQIMFHILELARKERNLHCDVVHITIVWVYDSFWITRSQRSRRRDKGLLCDYLTFVVYVYKVDCLDPVSLCHGHYLLSGV